MHTKTIILIILTCLNIGFIWWNSLQEAEISNSVSNTVAEAVKPVVVTVMKPVTAENGTMFGYKYNDFIRKTAHVLEFMALGILLVLLKRNVINIHITGVLFVALTVAVADETIQIFNGRTDSVKDILIDFAGAFAGMIISGAVSALVMKLKAKKPKT